LVPSCAVFFIESRKNKNNVIINSYNPERFLTVTICTELSKVFLDLDVQLMKKVTETAYIELIRYCEETPLYPTVLNSNFCRVYNLVAERSSFDANINVSVFETNIRIVGGLLSAHLMARRAGVQLEKGKNSL